MTHPFLWSGTYTKVRTERKWQGDREEADVAAPGDIYIFCSVGGGWGANAVVANARCAGCVGTRRSSDHDCESFRHGLHVKGLVQGLAFARESVF